MAHINLEAQINLRPTIALSPNILQWCSQTSSLESPLIRSSPERLMSPLLHELLRQVHTFSGDWDIPPISLPVSLLISRKSLSTTSSCTPHLPGLHVSQLLRGNNSRKQKRVVRTILGRTYTSNREALDTLSLLKLCDTYAYHDTWEVWTSSSLPSQALRPPAVPSPAPQKAMRHINCQSHQGRKEQLKDIPFPTW